MKKTPNIVFTDYSLRGIMDTLFAPKMQKLLFESVFTSIKNTLKTKKKEVIICDIIQVETSISIPKTHWVQALKSVLEYYVKVEDYSMCTQVNKLIKDIEDGRGIKT
jgi:hypothetical protein